MTTPSFALRAAVAVALLAAPAIALSAPGDLSFIPGGAGCWKAPSHASAGCTNGSQGLRVPQDVLVSPDGQSVYVAGGSGAGYGRLAAFSRDDATGELTQLSGTQKCITTDGSGGECATDATLGVVTALAMSPDGTSLYAVVDPDPSGFTGEGVVVYTRNTSTGALTHASCINAGGTSGCDPALWLADAESVAVSPDGASVYIGTTGTTGKGTVAAFARNAATGALTALWAPYSCVSNISTFGGWCTSVGDYELWKPVDLQVTPDGTQVVAASGSGVSILTRDAATGALHSPALGPKCFDTAVDPIWPCTRSYGLFDNAAVAISPDGRSIYGASSRGTADSGVGILDRDAATGLVTVPAGTASCLTQSGLAFQWSWPLSTSSCGIGRYTAEAEDVVVSPDGANVYAVNRGTYGGPQAAPAIDVFRRDTTTGGISQPGEPAGCLSQSGYSGLCLADTTHTSSIAGLYGVAISPDGANVYAVDFVASSLLVLKREPQPATPSGGGSSSGAGGSTAGGGSSSGGGSSARPKALAGGFLLRRGVGTTTGAVPAGATSVTQTARTGGSAATQGFLEMAKAKSAKGTCRITTVRNKKTKKVTKRTYKCTIRLSKGTWTVTTTARGKAGVVAEGSRRVVVR